MDLLNGRLCTRWLEILRNIQIVFARVRSKCIYCRGRKYSNSTETNHPKQVFNINEMGAVGRFLLIHLSWEMRNCSRLQNNERMVYNLHTATKTTAQKQILQPTTWMPTINHPSILIPFTSTWPTASYFFMNQLLCQIIKCSERSCISSGSDFQTAPLLAEENIPQIASNILTYHLKPISSGFRCLYYGRKFFIVNGVWQLNNWLKELTPQISSFATVEESSTPVLRRMGCISKTLHQWPSFNGTIRSWDVSWLLRHVQHHSDNEIIHNQISRSALKGGK